MKNPIRRSFRHDFRLPFRRNDLPISGIISRYFTAADASAAQCYQLSEPIEWVDDMVVQWDVYCPNVESVSNFISGSVYNQNNVYVDINDQTLVRLYTYADSSSLVGLTAGNLDEKPTKQMRMQLASNQGILSLSVDGELLIDSSLTSTGKDIGFFGCKVNQRYLEGTFSNIKIWKGTVNTSEEPTHSWAIDSDGSTGIELPGHGDITLTRVNMTSVGTDLFTLDESTDPNEWKNQSGPSGNASDAIPIGFTEDTTTYTNFRKMTLLDNSASAYYLPNSAVSIPAGSFVIRTVAQLKENSTHIFWGLSGATVAGFSYGNLQVRLGYTFIYSGLISNVAGLVGVNDGDLVTIDACYDASTSTGWIVVNGIAEAGVSKSAIAFDIAAIAARDADGLYSFSGVIAETSVWIGTVDTNQDPTYSWKLDSNGEDGIEAPTHGNISLTRVNLVKEDTINMLLNETTTPPQWEQQPSGLVIPVRNTND